MSTRDLEDAGVRELHITMPNGEVLKMLLGAKCIRCGAVAYGSERDRHGYGLCAKVSAVRLYDGDKDITPEGLFAP